ncbi:putative nucleic acid-binding Zn-ribbon protein [Sinorhizobium fredii]
MGLEDEAMELPKRAQKLEWNLNSILNLITLIGMIGGGGWIWANTTRDIEELQTWRTSVEQTQKDRLAESRERDGRTDERFRGLEAEVRKIDNLTYRVTITEQSTATITTAIKDLQTLLNQQSGDLKVVREILQRIEASQRDGNQLRR